MMEEAKKPRRRTLKCMVVVIRCQYPVEGLLRSSLLNNNGSKDRRCGEKESW